MSKFRRSYNNGNFTIQIEDFVAACDKRMTGLLRQSISDVIDNAQLATAKGGRMRVDTGFLRASGQASLTGMPTGPTRGEVQTPGHYDDGNKPISATVQTSLDGMEIGSTFFFGWTAEYARYREIYDGFLEGSLQHWGRIVAFNTETIRERIKQ